MKLTRPVTVSLTLIFAGVTMLTADSLSYRTGTGLQGLFRSIHRPDSGIADEKLRSEKIIPSETEIPAPVRVSEPEAAASVDPVREEERRSLPAPEFPFTQEAPAYYEALYLNNFIALSPKRYKALIDKAKTAGINTLITDVQPSMPKEEFIKYAKENGMYLVSRVVVFEGGLKKAKPEPKHLDSVTATAIRSVEAGFAEVQLDYIRFADYTEKMKVSKADRYRIISGVIESITEKLRPLGVRVGADTFGRISFNKDDIIGQKIEVFSPHLDTLYPMLYPSHFYGEPERIKNPYKTILEGTKNTVSRADAKTRVVPYIQAFKMSFSKSGLTYRQYMLKQIQAAKDSGGDGYAAWNPGGRYDEFFAALEDYRKLQKKSR